jgi:putative hemolysin
MIKDIVVDEYGIVQGIVTRTDLLEAVSGRFPDVDVPPNGKVMRKDDGSILIDAATPIADVAELLGLGEAPEKEFVTVAGLVLSKLEIAEMNGARISKVLARPSPQKS